MRTFFHRISTCFLSALFLVGLCACGSTGGHFPAELPSTVPLSTSGEAASDPSSPTSSSQEDSESQELTQPPGQTALMDTYRAVLQGDMEFVSVNTGKSLDITRLKEEITSEDLLVVAPKFTVVDLDRDQVPEVVLCLAMGNGSNDYVGFEILRYQDGAVYGYALWYRAFMQLKTDGTFSFSGGAGDYGFGTIAFTETAYTIDKITYCESTNPNSSYFVNHERAVRDEFLSAFDRFEKAEEAPWYELTPENIAAILSVPHGP